MEIIKPKKFIDLADVIFSEVTDEKDFNQKNLSDNLLILNSSIVNDQKFIWYIAKSISLKENDIIFCQTEVVTELFKLLKNEDSFKNITLITHQSDITITSSLFYKKPTCINRWFSTNVKHQDMNLIPIPIGVNNDYMIGYPNEKDFKNQSFKSFEEKVTKGYLNFNTNTRFLQRFHLKQLFTNKINYVVDENNLSKEKYLEKINTYKFIICPWGNGVDTHRLWETLYSNSIPVIKYHYTFSKYSDLPIVYLKNFKELKIDELKPNNLNINLDNTSADFNFWKRNISDKNITLSLNTEKKIVIKVNKNKFMKVFIRRRKFKQQYKKLKYFTFRIYKVIFLLLSSKKS